MRLEAFVFDAYGTLYDVHSVVARCESHWPGKGAQLSQLWRAKQLEYTWQRSLMQRYAPFSRVTREALAYACEALGLELDRTREEALMQEYLRLAIYPDVQETLKKLEPRKQAIGQALDQGVVLDLHPCFEIRDRLLILERQGESPHLFPPLLAEVFEELAEAGD